MTAQTPAERNRKTRQRKKERGLVKVESWVPPTGVPEMKALERKLVEAMES